jgi:hypothetical protein
MSNNINPKIRSWYIMQEYFGYGESSSHFVPIKWPPHIRKVLDDIEDRWKKETKNGFINPN